MPTIVNQGVSVIVSATPNVLLLGGTTEASALARMLAQAGVSATLSYAGRTATPRAQPVPVRVGGFGGVSGLATYLREHGVTHLVDATHPFAATMSAHAIEAARLAGIAHITLTRPAWTPVPGDRWQPAESIDAAIAALGGPARRVMLALGRMHVEAFAACPQHHYLLRFVDAPETMPSLPRHSLVIDRGPFTPEGDAALMREHGIEVVVCKNAGGSGAQAKLIAARALGLPVIMIERPCVPLGREVHDPAEVMRWLNHAAASTAERGV
ncbi:cobalt-precorrin-6A reductase [Novosphingobium beihaiensis]|uniref:Cobalt-precorrin-6A reductase n=1 Tax=Novosphingobium beihaiensis TaxID=2930389 RepID=A0ABT0BVH1_9SPHN|nr:cobalt-precorrin-6A reductase [Novosphingobium beihaiensis]MCJ2189007.1 cobalt-precorrin-6A reductase [Novosphingobium beihaiensis]